MKILLATDGSQFAEEAAWLLARLPHTEKLELTVAYVSNIPNLHGIANATELTKTLQLADQEKAKSLLSHLKSIFDGANATLTLTIGEGHVGTQIIRTAETQKSELIVLGALGHSLFERMFGSTSDFVASHAKCSVLVVRPTGLRNTIRPINVCVADDEADSTSAVFGQLAQFGWGANCKMDVVSIVSAPYTYSEIPIPFDIDEIITTRKKAIESKEFKLRELTPVVITHVIESIHVGDGLVQFANENKSDVIVLGSTGGGLLSTLLLGSVSRYVLRHAACSVWIARENCVA
jgi:nucleotide-binding universal stress UspA family protein